MNILAMDTATTGCSVALWRDGSFAAWQCREMARGQAEALVPMIADVLAEAAIGATDLDLIAVTRGPGAFTGLRIGLATARAMALAAGVPCLGVDTTDVIARNVSDEDIPGNLLVALDTKRADFYAQMYSSSRQPSGPPRALPPEELAAFVGDQVAGQPVVVAGDVTESVLRILGEAGISAIPASGPGLPDARRLAEIAAERWQPGQQMDPPRPLYLRPPDAKLPRDGGRLRP